MKRIFLLIVVVATAVIASGCTNTIRPYAAIVNGTTITQDEVNDELKITVNNPRYAALLDQQLSSSGSLRGLQPDGANAVNASYATRVVYNRILVTLIKQAVVSDSVVVTDANRASAQQAVEQDFGDPALYNSLPTTYRQYITDRIASLDALMASRANDQAAQAYFTAHKDDYTQYCIRHILVQSQQQAVDLRAQIVGGAPFADIAKANSADTGSATQGGDLGCVPKSQLSQFVSPFGETVAQLPPNTISEPVQTQYGYHLIEVTSRTEATYDSVAAQIKQTLGDPSAFFSEALAKAKIDVNARYGDFVPGNSQTSSPPTIQPHPARTLVSKSKADAAQTQSTDTMPSDPSQGVPETAPETVPDTTAPTPTPETVPAQ